MKLILNYISTDPLFLELSYIQEVNESYSNFDSPCII